jgi:hypothetical protein
MEIVRMIKSPRVGMKSSFKNTLQRKPKEVQSHRPGMAAARSSR